MKFYKFKSLRDNGFKFCQEIFIRRRLYFPQISELNDPNEAYFNLKLIQENNPYEGWASQLERTKAQNTRIYSLSTDKSNVLLWAHYSEKHEGICVEFDFEQSEKTAIYKVKYSKKVEPIYQGNVPSEVFEKALVLSKSKEWVYEKEWRMIQGAKDTYRNLEEHEITGVILGAKISPDNEYWVRYWMAQLPKAKLYRAVLKKDEYGLDIRAEA